MNRYRLPLATLGWSLALKGLAYAAGAGTGLPWDEPMTTISTALYGTPAHSIITAVIVFAGMAWA